MQQIICYVVVRLNTCKQTVQKAFVFFVVVVDVIAAARLRKEEEEEEKETQGESYPFDWCTTQSFLIHS